MLTKVSGGGYTRGISNQELKSKNMEPKFEQPKQYTPEEVTSELSNAHLVPGSTKKVASIGDYLKIAVYGVFAILMFFMATKSMFLYARVGFSVAALLFVYAIYTTFQQASGNKKYMTKNPKNEHLYKGVLFLVLAPVSYYIIILAIALPLLFIPPMLGIIGVYHLCFYAGSVFFKKNVSR